MYRDRSASTHVLLSISIAVLASAGCGTPDPTGIVIEFEEQALLSQADIVAIYFYESAETCDGIRAQIPRPPSVLGPFQTKLDDAGRAQGITFALQAPVNEYLVFVDALDINGGNVGSGCAPGQKVFDRQISRIRVVISAN